MAWTRHVVTYFDDSTTDVKATHVVTIDNQHDKSRAIELRFIENEDAQRVLRALIDSGVESVRISKR